MKRYRFGAVRVPYGYDIGMEEAPDGEYVKHEEVTAQIVAHLWADVPASERPADLIADLIERHDYWQKRAEGLEAFKRGVDAALNSGDGSYRP